MKKRFRKLKRFFRKRKKIFIALAVVAGAVLFAFILKRFVRQVDMTPVQQPYFTTSANNVVVGVEDLPEVSELELLPVYKEMHEKNKDMAGWLRIEGMVIDYPVMLTPGDENYYLNRDFNGNENVNGSLIFDTDSNVGTGTKADNYMYVDETGNVVSDPPSDNIIIHGHTMKNGNMFGDLDLFQEQEFGREHSIMEFDTLYEKRKYELISVFYTQVYYSDEDVFKFYEFFNADTQQEFDNWYENIKKMSLYDTGVKASFGDEFLTLSCCSYQTEDGRFVVIGKRIE
ncbi:MAG: class B sortase [Lachnospiraceae bacterium]|nr:class B sortase [Lachnospiraceae bacterium]